MNYKYDLTRSAAELAAEIYYNNEGYFDALLKKYKRYKASKDGVPIFKRQLPDLDKVNNKINNDFVGEVIDTKLGYMMSVPISYTYEKLGVDLPEDGDIDSDEQNIIDNFILDNDLDDLNLETLKMSSICGTASRLCYIDKEGNAAVVNVDPWTVAYVYDGTNKNLLLAVRFVYEVSSPNGEILEPKVTLKAEVYDENNVTYLVEENYNANIQITKFRHNFVLDTSVPNPIVKHGFHGIPLIEFVNNTERMGDCDKAIELVDVYDRCLSDQTSEVEQFRLAYLALYGLDASPEDIAKMKQTGAFKMTVDGKVEFITKNMDATVLENLLKQLKENIIRFSKSADFTDENFAGNLSGVAIKFKIIKLEHKASVSELKMKKADRQMWKILSSYYKIKQIVFNPNNIKKQFTRNLPVNLLEEARIQRELKGLVSNETRLGLASFIINPKKEIAKIEQEVESGIVKLLDEFYETMEYESDEGTINEDDEYNEWRKRHRQTGKSPEKNNDEM